MEPGPIIDLEVKRIDVLDDGCDVIDDAQGDWRRHHCGFLIEATNATHVWAERYDRALDDIFALQDELTISVVGAIEPTLRQAEVERARRKRPDSLDAYDLYLRALPNTFIAMPDTADEALDLLQQAIAFEPNYGAAHAAIAFCHEVRYIRGGLLKRTSARHFGTRGSRSRRAAMMRRALARGGLVIGILERDYDNAFDAFDRALALSPSSALALCFSAIVHAWAGEFCDRNRTGGAIAAPQPVRFPAVHALYRPGIRAFFRRPLR